MAVGLQLLECFFLFGLCGPADNRCSEGVVYFFCEGERLRGKVVILFWRDFGYFCFLRGRAEEERYGQILLFRA